MISKENHLYFASQLRTIMESEFPNVFSEKGIPFSIVEGEGCCDQGSVIASLGNVLVFLGTLTVIPRVLYNRYDIRFSLEMYDNEDVYSSIDMKYENDVAASLSPSSMFCFIGRPSVESGKVFYWERKYGDSSGTDWMVGNVSFGCDSAKKALAYAVAVKLMEIERSGVLSASKTPESKSVSELPVENTTRNVSATPPYKIVSFARDRNERSRYRFRLKVSDEMLGDLGAIRTVKQHLRIAIEEDYRDANTKIDKGTINVDFSKFEMDAGEITGEAIVTSRN